MLLCEDVTRWGWIMRITSSWSHAPPPWCTSTSQSWRPATSPGRWWPPSDPSRSRMRMSSRGADPHNLNTIIFNSPTRLVSLERLHRSSRSVEQEEINTQGDIFRRGFIDNYLVLSRNCFFSRSILCSVNLRSLNYLWYFRITKPPSASKGGLMEKFIKVNPQ